MQKVMSDECFAKKFFLFSSLRGGQTQAAAIANVAR